MYANPQTQQQFSLQRASHRNTAACIAKSVNQEKSRRHGLTADAPLRAQEHFSADVSSVNRHSDSISEIASEPICPENSEVSCVGRGKGRGRGNCGRGRPLEVLPGIRKNRHHTQPRERSASPKQDFTNAPGSPQSPTISRWGLEESKGSQRKMSLWKSFDFELALILHFLLDAVVL